MESSDEISDFLDILKQFGEYQKHGGGKSTYLRDLTPQEVEEQRNLDVLLVWV